MKIADALRLAKERTNSANVARTLMRFHSNLNNESLFLKELEELEHEGEFFALVSRYEDGEPLEYITGACEFFGREFSVGEGVLIPRCETEILVEKTIEIAHKFENPKICEIGTGSGIIAICLASALPNAKIIATDISENALKYAKANAIKYGVKVQFVHSNLIDNIQGNFDIVVSNPPYIAKNYALDKWVLKEPHEALYGGERGDELLCEIIKLSSFRTKYLLCEMGYDQKDYLAPILETNGFKAEFYKDLAGFDRGFCAVRLV